MIEWLKNRFTKQDPSKRGQPRRRVQPLWRKPVSRWAALALVLVAGAGTGWKLWTDGWVARIAEETKWQAIAWSGDLGFVVDDVLVVGRNQTSRDDLLQAVGLARGAPILAFDLDQARKRVEELSWVRSASVERMLPDTVLLSVVERKPLALWQTQGRFHLIDGEGEVILKEGVERFSDLLIVVGDDAPAHAARLIDILQTQPQLMSLVESAVRVGARRWNVRLKGGIDVRLPADAAQQAWARLAEYEQSHGVLARDVRVLDLRLPDRLIVKKISAPDIELSAGGQQT